LTVAWYSWPLGHDHHAFMTCSASISVGLMAFLVACHSAATEGATAASEVLARAQVGQTSLARMSTGVR
jgi:hypothetical protein